MKNLILFGLGLIAWGYMKAGRNSSAQPSYQLSSLAQSALSELDPSARPAFAKFLQEIESKGWRVSWYSGHRPESTGSWHKYKRALDLNLVGPNGQVLKKQGFSKQDWAWVGALATAIGLRWGGDFSTPDINHFDLPI